MSLKHKIALVAENSLRLRFPWFRVHLSVLNDPGRLIASAQGLVFLASAWKRAASRRLGRAYVVL
jgi:hypothetical protein